MLHRKCETIRPTWIIDANYLLPAIVSISSFIKHIDMECTLYCLVSDYSRIHDTVTSLIPRVIVRSYEASERYNNRLYGQVVDNRMMRFDAIAQAHVDQTILLIDADTIFDEGIRDLVSLLIEYDSGLPTIWGVVEYESALDAYLYFKSRNPEGIYYDIAPAMKEMCYDSVYGNHWRQILSAPQPNNGLLAFKNCSHVTSVWRAFYERGLQHYAINPEDDQVPLAAAMVTADCCFVRLHDRYNSKGAVNGFYAMFHPYAGLWRNEFRAALAPISDISQCANICRDILEGLPQELLSAYRLGEGEPYHYLAIPGFFDFSDLYFEIARDFQEGHFVEIGTYRGKSTCFMAELIRSSGKKIKFISIDAYIRDVTFETVSRCFTDKGLSNYVTLLNMRSDAASRLFVDESLDFVFIDGGHAYAEVLDDLEMVP